MGDNNPIPDEGIMCHRTGFKRRCRDIVSKNQCRLWIGIQGHNPNTGTQIERWDCADAVQHLLMIENSQQQRGTQKAIESFRNEMVRMNDRSRLVNAPTVPGAQDRIAENKNDRN